MKRVLILGAGGHAQVIADILLQTSRTSGELIPIGYLDDDPRLLGQSLLGLPVLGKISELPAIPHEGVIVGIGDNRLRSTFFSHLLADSQQIVIAQHPTSIVAPDVALAPGCVLCAGAIVNPGSSIGVNVIINTGSSVDHHNQIADHAHVAPGVHLGGDVQIGMGALIGIGATVIPQRSVGDWSVVGAGSVVMKNIPAGVMAIGTPAHIIRKINQDR